MNRKRKEKERLEHYRARR